MGGRALISTGLLIHIWKYTGYYGKINEYQPQ